MADEGTLERVQEVLREAKRPLMIGEIAQMAGVSRPTASKYVEICEALGLAESRRYATARQVTLRTRRSAQRVGRGG